jgi:hypothetical protein
MRLLSGALMHVPLLCTLNLQGKVEMFVIHTC